MNKFFVTTCVASMFALGCVPAFSADLSGDERTELRQRAEALQAERQRNPGWDGGRTRLSQTRSDVPLDRNRGDVKMPQRGEVKAKPKSAKKAKREPMRNKAKRAAKQVPGAFVRK